MHTSPKNCLVGGMDKTGGHIKSAIAALLIGYLIDQEGKRIVSASVDHISYGQRHYYWLPDENEVQSQQLNIQLRLLEKGLLQCKYHVAQNDQHLGDMYVGSGNEFTN